ncbi:unnamed protein product, partial [Prorocentrum cordatum]
RGMARRRLLALAAAALGAAAAPPGAASCPEAEAEGQQEREHAAMRVQALQTGSALGGARGETRTTEMKREADPAMETRAAPEVAREAKQPEGPYTAADAEAFVGGYTVSGHSIASSAVGGAVVPRVEAFSVAQECMCSCQVTSHALACLGANDGNAFSALGFKEDGQWVMEQYSINGSVNGFQYHATMRFDAGGPPGGARHVTGHTLASPGEASVVTQFRAEHSATGCFQGVGAASCPGLCASYGLDASQLVARCGL